MAIRRMIMVSALISPVLEMDGRARMVDWYDRFLTEVTDLEDSPPSMAPYCGDYTTVYLPSDRNRDCYTNLIDLSYVAAVWIECTNLVDLSELEANWLKCTDPADPCCDEEVALPCKSGSQEKCR